MNPSDALLKKSTDMLAQTTAEGSKPFAGSTYDAITPAALTPKEAFTPVTTPPQTITTPFLNLTPQEQQAQADVRNQQSSITSLLGDLSGENTYRGQVSADQNLIGKESAITSYQNQLQNLQKEAQGIDLQLAQTLQSDQAKGGVSTFQLSANQQGTQRIANQAKLTNAIQQYSLGAQLQAAQGDYATALKYVDQAVALKYQGKKDQLTAAQANLENLLKSPDLTAAEQKRAQAMQLQITAQQKEVAKQEENAKTIQGLALQAQQNGAPAAIIGRIMNAKDITEALIASSGFTQKETEASIQRYNKAVSTGYKGSFADYVTFEKNAKTTVPTGGGFGTGTYKSDLDALIGNTLNLIPSLNGKQAFQASIKGARNDADRFNAVATVVLKNSPGEIRNDFVKQKQGIADLDKALELLNKGVQTGLIEAGTQYTYNLLGKDFDPNLSKINAYITSAIQPYRSSITGAAWGDQEDAEYSNLFGSTKYSPEELKARLETIKSIMLNKSIGALDAQVNPLGGSSFGGVNTIPVGTIKPGKDGKNYKKVEGGWVPA